jgi:peptide/nickel transport system substrate-binding protein
MNLVSNGVSRQSVRLVSIAVCAFFTGAASIAAELAEPPFFAEKVEAGDLPPVGERVPAEPEVIDLEALGKTSGSYGGTLRTLIGKAKDTRRLVVYGYARLVGYDENLELKPDILKDYSVEEGRIFTFHLRKGHRWSDGHLFTSEDFRYFWEDVQTNEELAPGGVTRELLVDGEPPKVEIVDELTVRYTWSKPNPTFLNALAAPNPLYIYRPAHYLKQYHPRYTDRAKLEAMAEEAGKRNWVALHFSHDRPYQNSDPTRPTLQPWLLMTEPPSDRFVFDRNPYYHRIDAKGHQLPYIDRVTMTVASPNLIPAKVGSGESDLQSDHINFANYTFLKKAEARSGFDVLRWTPGKGAKMALYPNMNHKDPHWRKLFQDKRFRHALSMAIDRDEINKVMFFDLGIVGNNTVLPQCPLAKPEYRSKWAQYDPAMANKLLDELGLTERNGEGIRLLPNGDPLMIIVETAGEDLQQVDILDLIGDDWQQIGVKLFTKSTQREVFRRRVISGETQIAVWSGLDNAMPTPDWSPFELVPTDKNELQWPQWGQYYETNGQTGEKPDLEPVLRLLELYDRWQDATDVERRRAAWEEILDIHAEQQFSIGLVAAVPQIVVVNSKLRNIPESAFYNWEPGSYFGIYRPDTFWFDG